MPTAGHLFVIQGYEGVKNVIKIGVMMVYSTNMMLT